MKNTITYILLISALILSSCSTNQELASLKEYDDLYYAPSPNTQSNTLASIDSDQPDWYDEASAAESRYYTDSPAEETTKEERISKEEEEFDYYEEDYGRRIQNFHRSEENQYNPGGFGGVGAAPRVNMNFGMSMGRFGPSSMMGMNMMWGSPMMMNPGFGSPMMGWNSFGCDPWRSNFGMYDPFCPWGPFGYDPFMRPGWGMNPGWGMGYMGMRWNNPWMNPWGNPWGAPVNAWGDPIYGGVYGNPYVVNTPSPTNQSSRRSRDGVVGSNNPGIDGRSSSNPGREGSTNENETIRRNRTSVAGENTSGRTDRATQDAPDQSDIRTNRNSNTRSAQSRTTQSPRTPSGDYYNSGESTRYGSRTDRSVTTPQSSRNNSNREIRSTRSPYSQPTTRPRNTRSTISPYTREQQQRTNGVNRSIATPRYNSSPSRSNGNRYNSGGNRSSGFSSPSQSTSSPSRSTGGGSRRR